MVMKGPVLAIAEVRQEDCEVVIYRNNPADLRIVCNDDVKLAITQSQQSGDNWYQLN